MDFDFRNPDYASIFRQRAEKLSKLRAAPEKLGAIKLFYKDNPVQFIQDWGMTSDPRNAEIGLPVSIPFILFPKQEEFIEWLYARWKKREDGLTEKSRDMGVSWLCCAAAVHVWLFYTGSVVGFGSRKEEYVDKLGDPKSLFFKIRQFISFLPAEFRPTGYDEGKHALCMRILNPENGASIVGESGDNIGRGNRTSLYLKDESAFYEHPEAIDAALSQTSNCKIDVSTPNGAGNPFYRKRHSGKIPVFVFDWRDDPRKDNDWYLKQKSTLDPVIVAQEIDRSYTASVSNAFIPEGIVSESMTKLLTEVDAIGPLLVGVDVARYGDDKSVITFRRGRVAYKQEFQAKFDVVDVYGWVKDEIRAFGYRVDQIAVDTIGIGAGVADMLRRDFAEVVVDVNSALRLNDGQNYNLRSRIWRDMRDWIKNGALLPNDPDLKTDLTALQYGYQNGGLLLIEDKKEAKKRGIKSPDRADSLALTFAYPVEFYGNDDSDFDDIDNRSNGRSRIGGY